MNEQMEVTESNGEDIKKKPKVYLPGRPLKKDEQLVYDPSAYIMLHEAQTGAPCLSFDVIPDGEGNDRTEFPLTTYLVAGTQAETRNGNNIIVMRVSNMMKTFKENNEDQSSDEDSSDSSSDEFPSKLPKLDSALIRHQGAVNRIRATVAGGRVLAAVWSEIGSVTIVDLKPQLLKFTDPSRFPLKKEKKKKKGVGEPMVPLQVFTGHPDEGYGLDWSPTSKGVLATGDCKSNIFVWLPKGGNWEIDDVPLTGHTDSVEDIQWSPNEPNVLASCSVDRTIRIWDTREQGPSACKLTVKAHKSDINVISWSRREPFIVSGGDDGFLNIWDLRNFKTNNPVGILKHHFRAITSVEWSPHESSVFASSGEDDQIALWDLAAERDDSADIDPHLNDLPPQLLFIHQGQNDIKELHWHSQIPGLVISTANSGFNFFKTISV